MADAEPWFWLGSRAAVKAHLEASLGPARSPRGEADCGKGVLVVVDSHASIPDLAAVSGGHAFGAVRALRHAGARVHVVVDAGDRIGAELARFCLATGVVTWDAGRGELDLGDLAAGGPQRERPSVDGLLARIERELAASGEQEGTVQRLLRFERDHSPLQRLQDPETGLFDGPYATWKLDEEWKRARRFHQPLSLVLMDLGQGPDAMAPAQRAAVLADAAGVFLNECRDIDVIARFAPSTFLFLLPGTGPDGAEVLARRMMEGLRPRMPAGVAKALAAGIATVPASHIPDRKAFLMVAEACLRRAQSAGGGGQVVATWQ